MGVKVITIDHTNGEGLDELRLEIETEHNNGWIDLNQLQVKGLITSLSEWCDGDDDIETASTLDIPDVVKSFTAGEVVKELEYEENIYEARKYFRSLM
jgi:hypothetical protein